MAAAWAAGTWALMSAAVSPCAIAVCCAVKKPGNAEAALASTKLPPPARRDFMQIPPNIDEVQPRENCHPSFGGLPCARTSNPLPPMLRVLIRSRKNEKFCGVLNARLYVTRKFCVSDGLKISAARGETCVPSI